MEASQRLAWADPPRHITLQRDEVHVWRASLTATTPQREALWQLLPPDEQARARRFHFEHHRQRWTIAHGVLRLLLSRYLACPADAISFSLNPYGKPALASPTTEPALHFNLSHSDDLALYAFAYRREVGIDVEHIRSDIDFSGLARHSFSANEQALLTALPVEQQCNAFFQCWSRKEAYIKARGMGLSLPLDLFDVELRPTMPARLLASREDAQEPQCWSMVALDPGPDEAGALVVAQHASDAENWQLSCWQWSPEMLHA